MGYDPFLPLAATQINVLCLPVQRIKHDRLYKLVSQIQNAAVGHRRDTTTSVTKDPSSKNQDQVGLPSTPRHALSFNFGLQSHVRNIEDSFFFEPNREIQLVLGIVDVVDEHGAELDQVESRFEQHIEERFPAAFSHALAIVSNAAGIKSKLGLEFDPHDEKSCLQLIENLAELFYASIDTLAERVMNRVIAMPRPAANNDRLNGAESRHDSLQLSRTSTGNSGTSHTMNTGQPNNHAASSETSEARRLVTRGILNLQRGLLPKALDQLADGARRSRDLGDQAWHARALEVMLNCMLLHLWFDVPFSVPQDCYPTMRGVGAAGTASPLLNGSRSSLDMFSFSPVGGTAKAEILGKLLPGLMSSIMDLYERASNGTGERLPSLLVCEARLRFANLAIVVKHCGTALGSDALKQLVIPQDTIHPVPLSTRREDVPGLVIKSSVLANMIIDTMTEAQARLSLQDCIALFIAACHALSKLRLERKQGLYLKELLQKIAPALLEARRVGAAEAGVHPSSRLTSAGSKSQLDKFRVSSGLQSLLRVILSVYGLPDPFSGIPHGQEGSSHAAINHRLSSWLKVFTSGDIALKIEVLRLCIRVTEALPDIPGSVHCMALLVQVSKQAIMISAVVPASVPLIAPEEQSRLLSAIKRASSVAEKEDQDIILVQYWDDFLVRSVVAYDHPPAGQLVSHTSQDLSMTTASGTGKKDPFIYNPFSETGSKRDQPTLVRDEIASFDVVLQNPLEVEVEIESISLATEGVGFEPLISSVVLAPLCTQTIMLQGKPTTDGDLRIIGCNANIKGFRKQTFFIFPNMWSPQRVAKKPRDDVGTSSVNAPVAVVQSCEIIPPLPQLHLISKPHPLMLLEGESREITVTLENDSPCALPADLLLFTYNDTVTSRLQSTLANSKDLPPTDVYELQYALSSRPTIRRIDRNIAKVQPGRSQTFTFEVYAKLDLTQVDIYIDYTYLGKEQKEVEGTFWTRQIRYVLDVTVCASVDIARCAIVNIPSESMSSYKSGEKYAFSSQQEGSSTDEDFCLLQLDLRSTWLANLDVSISTRPAGDTLNDWALATTATLTPGNPTRTLAPIPKLRVADPHAVIPSLDTKRQFVVSASKLSLEAELGARESFWFREKLCSLLKIEWAESGEEHKPKGHGEIDIRRGIRLTSRMIDALKVEDIPLRFNLLPASSPTDTTDISQIDQSSFLLKRNIFARLIVTISNHTQDALYLLLRLQPSLRDQPHSVAMDLSKKLIWSGVLQQAIHGAVQPGSTRDIELGLVALIEGRFEINATVEELRASKTRTDILLASGESNTNERRIWYAERPCHITVVDDIRSET